MWLIWIAPCFAFQAAAVHAPQEFVVGVDFLIALVGTAAGLVDSRQHDIAMYFLDRPARGNESGREMVEEFRMSGWLAQGAEVARRPDQAFAKVMLPNPIDHYACSERVIAGCDGPGQFQAAAPFGEKLMLVLVENGQESVRRVLP